MAKVDEFERIAETGVFSSNFAKTSQYVPTISHAKLQRSDEVELLASFLQVLPLRKQLGKIEQNIKSYNFYIIAQCIIDSAEYNLESFISLKLSEIEEVEYILTSKDQNILHVWIVLNNLDREVRKKIYDIEYNILDHFKDIYFDFHVICRSDRDIDELLTRTAIMIYRGRNK